MSFHLTWLSEPFDELPFDIVDDVAIRSLWTWLLEPFSEFSLRSFLEAALGVGFTAGGGDGDVRRGRRVPVRHRRRHPRRHRVPV